MKKLFILAAALTASMATLTSCGQGNAKLATDMDSLAYAIGTDLGSMAFQFDSTMNPQILSAMVTARLEDGPLGPQYVPLLKLMPPPLSLLMKRKNSMPVSLTSSRMA